MNEIIDLIHKYGELFYLVTFIWAALEGETFVIFAAFAAQRGILHIEPLFLSAWLGSLCGDQVFFFMGRKFGTSMLQRTPTLKPKVDRVLGWLEKYAVAFILSYRFMYGVRNISGIAVGMSHLPWRDFVFWNTIAAMVWAVAFCSIGYFFGDMVERLQNSDSGVSMNVGVAMLAVLALLCLFVGIRVSRARALKNQRAQALEQQRAQALENQSDNASDA